MRSTDDPVAFVFTHPQAKAILYHLEKIGPVPYERLRAHVGLDSMSFHRTTRRLVQFNLLWLRAPEAAAWQGQKVRLVAQLSPDRRDLVKVFHQLDDVLQRSPAVPAETRELLAVE